MKRYQLITFLSIALLIYGLLNIYIFYKGWEIVSHITILKITYFIVFLLIALSFPAGRFLERISISFFSNFLMWFGSIYLAVLAYAILFFLFFDILQLVIRFIPPYSVFYYNNIKEIRTIIYLVILLTIIILVIIGLINAANPIVRKLSIKINKRSMQKSLKIALASDIHLGTIICKKRIEKIIEKINEINPDIILLAGDVVDEDLKPVINQNLGETLKKLKSRYGVYAITGNHEYIGGEEAAVKYLTEHNVRVLRDEMLCIDNSFYLVGREDISIKQFKKINRTPLEKILEKANKKLPIILMDHQPFKLIDSVKNEVDLQLSGHTHHGQLWPFNIITTKIFEISWGYKKINDSHFYVSCGVGTWGPPVRIGNKPEIVYLKVDFLENEI